MAAQFDYVLVGGGLQSALIALALHAEGSSASVALVEKSARLGGNHTWCFHAGDISSAASAWIAPLICNRWPGYRVRFHGRERCIERGYAAITSERLDRVIHDVLSAKEGGRLFQSAAAKSIGPNRVELEDGTSLEGKVVIDARGPGSGSNGRAGYQKFVGLELDLAQPHRVDLPILMDATVEQTDGFRFLYTLPLSPQRLLVEDTYFSNDPELEREALRAGILDHVAANGLQVKRIVREEEGLLPMPWAGEFQLPHTGPLVAGYRGGFFHPGTGYSLPVAARLAEVVASCAPEELFGKALWDFARAHERQASFCRFLNSMLFRWYPPHERWHVFKRFYGLSVETIERFYALRLRPIDRGRLLMGRPPRGFSPRYRLARGVQ
ncbi:MAG: lycopene beta-cyclase CrtY [Candidatus Latescibacterota bacterium]|nr:MAG: lycopene beta-cyclase CrtY [Candidatus Latescibacterota bacterium]